MARQTNAQLTAAITTKDAYIAQLEAKCTKLQRSLDYMYDAVAFGDTGAPRAPCEPTKQASLPIDRPGDPCGRCGGSGKYGHHGVCYLCDGSGKFPGKKAAALNFAKRRGGTGEAGLTRRADREAAPVSDRRAAMDAAKAEAQRTGRTVGVA